MPAGHLEALSQVSPAARTSPNLASWNKSTDSAPGPGLQDTCTHKMNANDQSNWGCVSKQQLLTKVHSKRTQTEALRISNAHARSSHQTLTTPHKFAPLTPPDRVSSQSLIFRSSQILLPLPTLNHAHAEQSRSRRRQIGLTHWKCSHSPNNSPAIAEHGNLRYAAHSLTLDHHQSFQSDDCLTQLFDLKLVPGLNTTCSPIAGSRLIAYCSRFMRWQATRLPLFHNLVCRRCGIATRGEWLLGCLWPEVVWGAYDRVASVHLVKVF